MSTIDPSTLDPTKPETGEATTASVRANELATQTQLQNAKNDVEALEAHVVDGTIHFAQSAIDHLVIQNIGANTHAQIDSHIASIANPHSVTAAQVGAIPAVATADGDLFSFDGTNYTKLGVGADGTVLTARPGAGIGLKLAWEPGGGGSVTNPPTTPGDLWTHDGTSTQRLPGGTNGQMLYRDTGEQTGMRWGDAPTGTGDVTSTSNTVNNQVQLGDNPPKGIKGSADLTFDPAFGALAISHATAQAVLTITSNGNSEAEYNMRALGAGTADKRAFGYTVAAGSTQGFLGVRALTDNFGFVRNIVQYGHNGGIMFGNPTGSVPGVPGILNAENVLINNVPVIVSAADTSDDEVQVGDAATRHIKGAGFGSTDIARLSQANTFAAAQTINAQLDVNSVLSRFIGDASLDVQLLSTSGNAALGLQNSTGALDTRRFDLQSAGNAANVRALTDAGVLVRNLLEMNHSGTIEVPGTLTTGGQEVYHPGNPPPGGGVTNPPTTKGDLWTHDGATTVRLPVGATNGHVLSVNSAQTSGLEWVAAGGGGGGATRVHVAAVDLTGLTEVIVDSFSASKLYIFRFSNVSTSTDSYIQLQARRVGQPSFDNGGTDYKFVFTDVTSQNGSWSSSSNGGITFCRISGLTNTVSQAQGFFELADPLGTSRHSMVVHMGGLRGGGGNHHAMWTGTMLHNQLSQIEAIRVYTASGTFSEGELTVHEMDMT